MRAPHVHNPPVGESLDVAIDNATRSANATGHTAICMFNGVPIVAFPGDVSLGVLARFRHLERQQSRAWKRTAEYKKQKAEWRECNKLTLKAARALVAEMRKADLSDLGTALGFIEEATKTLGWSFTTKEAAAFNDLLLAAGYQPSANTGEDFDYKDRENVARYIIGQALASPDGPHGILACQVAGWREKFEQAGVTA
jgi:hypothetical protein